MATEISDRVREIPEARGFQSPKCSNGHSNAPNGSAVVEEDVDWGLNA